ncbi:MULTISPECIES: D-alanyl-D-alanine carboxypeptidase family protein [Metabacillus]|jgi:serine-type D-Ala-D-Ala carboxypeptidase (penicillin-binding protein 5/6)|uniref:serine-type D-Ala-D-Ala carboxypeptidase n=1 Tax=Metabacillus rhizolycopersici TaxID=2875709 RepID=A0ABS7UQU0_9BACI|nr:MULTISPECIES: D-alanyl-D-alanine carboxypeptidase family protein [Metabacillus]MBZ5750422.1 D-alanyl-D-alanine carboxypeptidase [Metabacillus rhizolycopersici]MCM3652194.1 D-alanyl-D-alanine carboxypeptidase [Metabacillus litoralis]
MKRIISCFMLIAMLISVTPVAFAKESSVELADRAKSAVLIERDTGTILYDKNSDQKLPPASMTKIMTMLLIMEALEKNQIKMDEKVRTSEYAASMGGSQIFLEPGEEMTVEQMLKGIAIGSGNDASVAMAEKIAGSAEAFVEMMNKKVEELGLKNTHFKNPTGLPEADHYSSAQDMALMAKELLKYEEITKYTGKYEDYLREGTDKKFWLVNTNRLVKFYPGVDGVKTGFTNEAKYCLTATAKKDNMRVIAVVFGADTPKDRNAQVTKMLDYAFSQYQTHPLFKKDQILTKMKVSKGSENEANLMTSEPISILTKKGENVDDVTQEIVMKKDVRAPIKRGDELGSLQLKKDEKIIAESKLVAEKNIDEASWWKLFKRVMGDFTKSS